METLKSVYINEMMKISKKKKLIITIIFSTLFVILAGIAIYLLNNFAGIRVTGSSDFSIMVLNILSYTIFPLLAASISIDMFTGEFVDNTIKFTLTGPASRMKVFLGKIFTVATFIMGNLLYVMIISTITSIIINRNIPHFFNVFVSYLMVFVPILVFALVVILISNIAKGTTSAFMFSVFVFLLFNGLAIFFPQIKSFLFTSALDWHRLILGNYINYGKILRVFLILLGYCIMLVTAGYYLFEKRDI